MNKFLLSNWTLDFEDMNLCVKVPGDVVNDLMQNGILDDCLYSDNYKKASWVHDRDWTYSTTFTLIIPIP